MVSDGQRHYTPCAAPNDKGTLILTFSLGEKELSAQKRTECHPVTRAKSARAKPKRGSLWDTTCAGRADVARICAG